MQNRLNVRQKDHDGSLKTTCHERGKKYHFQKGGGINIVFGPKYRPLPTSGGYLYLVIYCNSLNFNKTDTRFFVSDRSTVVHFDLALDVNIYPFVLRRGQEHWTRAGQAGIGHLRYQVTKEPPPGLWCRGGNAPSPPSRGLLAPHYSLS
jgi:hypothetical protein